MNHLMRHIRLFLAIVTVVAASAAYAGVHSDHAHVHGVASLQIAVDGERVTLEFSSPLDNLIGFERAPRTDKEKAAVRQLLERLQRPEDLLVPSPDARCVRTSSRIEAPVLDAQRGPDAAVAKRDAGASQEKGKGAGKSHKAEHAGLSAEVAFRCEQPQNLKGLRVALFDAFPRLGRIDAQVAGTPKQIAAKLTSRNRTISW